MADVNFLRDLNIGPLGQGSNNGAYSSGLGGGYQDMNASGIHGPLNQVLSQSEWGRFALDPMDLFGSRAAQAQAEQNAIAMGSAERSINALRDQYNTTQGLQSPFLNLGYLGLGQMGQYEQGANFNQQLNEGSRALRGGALASGLGNSSAAGRNQAGFLLDLTNEDMNRQRQQALNNVLIGQNAVGVLGQAAQGLGSGASSIYGNWGQQSAQNALNYGQARNNSLTGAGQAIAGLGNYLDYQGGR